MYNNILLLIIFFTIIDYSMRIVQIFSYISSVNPVYLSKQTQTLIGTQRHNIAI